MRAWHRCFLLPRKKSHLTPSPPSPPPIPNARSSSLPAFLQVLLHSGPWYWQTLEAPDDGRSAASSSASPPGAATPSPPAPAADRQDLWGGGGGGAEGPAASSFTPADEDAARGEASELLGRLMSHAAHGSMIRLSLQRLLPPGLVATVAEGPPDAVLRALGQSVESPECIWDTQMASAAAAQVGKGRGACPPRGGRGRGWGAGVAGRQLMVDGSTQMARWAASGGGGRIMPIKGQGRPS